MRSVLFILLILTAVFTWLYHRPVGPPDTTAAVDEHTLRADSWRRTAEGWERRSDWKLPGAAGPTTWVDPVHPLAVMLLLVLASLGSLLAFEPSPSVVLPSAAAAGSPRTPRPRFPFHPSKAA